MLKTTTALITRTFDNNFYVRLFINDNSGASRIFLMGGRWISPIQNSYYYVFFFTYCVINIDQRFPNCASRSGLKINYDILR